MVVRNCRCYEFAEKVKQLNTFLPDEQCSPLQDSERGDRMHQFVMDIAGFAIGVESLFETTRVYCREYWTDREPEFFVTVGREDLAREQAFLDAEADEEGLKRRKFPEPFLERSVIQRRVAEALAKRDVLLMHGSTVAVDGKAYLFTAPCKTGKSTHTRLWREAFGARAVMVNDDMPFLQITSGGVLAYGSPWSGKHGLATNICVPLQGICFLNRGKENVIHRIEAERGIPALRRQMHMPTDEKILQNARSLVDKLAENVPLWEMYCNKEPEAARVSYAAMSGDE